MNSFEKIGIGYSDIARLICLELQKKPYDETLEHSYSLMVLGINEDGAYNTRFLEYENVKIPKHYTLAYSCRETLEFEMCKHDLTIDIYMDGEFGCIIHVHS